MISVGSEEVLALKENKNLVSNAWPAVNETRTVKNTKPCITSIKVDESQII